MRDSDGFVLCHHGRPIRCLECGDEYEAELSRGVDGGPLAPPEADKPANTDSSSPASSPPERSEALEAICRQCGHIADIAARMDPPERSEGWQPIETAPKDGTRVDLCAKAWLPAFDRFESRRFPDCVWMKGDPMCNRSPYWLNLDKDWYPTHWIPLPALPPEPSNG
jgi:hypothetical protein